MKLRKIETGSTVFTFVMLKMNLSTPSPGGLQTPARALYVDYVVYLNGVDYDKLNAALKDVDGFHPAEDLRK